MHHCIFKIVKDEPATPSSVENPTTPNSGHHFVEEEVEVKPIVEVMNPISAGRKKITVGALSDFTHGTKVNLS